MSHRTSAPLFKTSLVDVFLILISVLLAYSATFHISYLHHDSYQWFSWDRESCRSHPQRLSFLNDGRPLAWLVICGMNNLVNSVDDSRMVRFLSALMVYASALIFYFWMRSNFRNRYLSLSLAIGFATLPAAQVWVGWMECSFQPVAAIFSLSAVVLFFQSERAAHWRRWLLRIGAAFLLFASYMTYQSVGCLYWTLLGLVLLFRRELTTPVDWRFMRRMAIVGMVPTLLYFLWFRISLLSGWLPQIRDKERFAIPRNWGDIMARLSTFFDEIVPRAANLWTISDSWVSALLVIFFIAFGFVIYFVRARKHLKRPVLTLLLSSTAFITIFFLSYGPNLLVGSHVAYRTMGALQLLILGAVLFGVTRLSSLLGQRAPQFYVLCIALISSAGVYVASMNVITHLAIPSAVEFRFIRKKLIMRLRPGIEEVHIVRPFVPPDYTNDEFSRLSTSYDFNVAEIVQVALREADMGDFPLQRITSGVDPDYDGGEKTLVINVNDVLNYKFWDYVYQ